MPRHLRNGEIFPHVEIPSVGGGVLDLPRDLGGSFGVVMIYRGHWCPFCNEQMAAFASASASLAKEGIEVVAFSVDDEATTKEFIAKRGIPFKMGHSARVETIVEATGAYENEAPTRGHFLGFRARAGRNHHQRDLLESSYRPPCSRRRDSPRRILEVAVKVS
jgi:peroxiredoxin